MSSCNNKFLGVDGIEVIKEYIDKKVQGGSVQTNVCTLQLYKYSESELEASDKPNENIYFDFELNRICFPSNYSDGWDILSKINVNASGSIYVSSKFQVGNNSNGTSSWSNPIKVSGVNGLNGKNGTNFVYSYKSEFDKNDYSTIAPELNETNSLIYYWMYIDELPEDGTPGSIWAKYTTDGKDGVDGKDGKDGVDGKYIAYEYCVTAEYDNKTTGDWERFIPEISKEKPYLWVRTQSVAAQSQPDPANWEQAVLLSYYGKDGTVPDYNVTLYKKGEHFECPETLKFEDGYTIEDLFTNNPDWKTLPTDEVEEAPALYNIDRSVGLTTKEEIDAILAENSNTPVEFKLDTDIDLINTALVINSEVTIDLNGCTLTGGLFAESKGNILEGTSDSYVFWVKEGGKLIINDSVGTGKVIAREADYSMAVWCNGGEVIINGGNFYNAGDNCDLIYASALVKEDGTRVGSTITINGGYFEATDKLVIPGAGTGYKRSALNIKNADADICSITVTGGQFLDFDPTNLDKEVPGVTMVPENLEAVVKDGIVIIKKPTPVYESPVWWKCTIKVSGKDDKVLEIGDIFRYNAIDGNAKDGKYTKFMYKWSETQAAPELIDNTSIKPEGWDYNPVENKITGPNASLWMITAEFDIPNESGEVLKYNWTDPVKISGEPVLSPYIFKTRNFYCIGNISGTNLPKWDSNNWKDLNKISNNLKNDQYIWAAEYVVRYPITYIKDKNGNYEFDENGNYKYTIAETYDNIETYPTSAVRFSGTNGKDGSNGADAANSNYIMISSEPGEISIPVPKSDYENYNIYVAKAKVDYKMDIEPIKFSDGVSYRICNMSGEVITIYDDNYQFTGIDIENTNSLEIPNNKTLNIVCYKPNANSTPQYFIY